ncbi:RNA polymerase sigma factor [Streptomyces sp. NRRL B-3229]|uniref:RNA polymerase sigma factor n=1 Tax=Streptomyces sp. NRRL B-3229 TaxID=1463836 RepID=UPI0004C2461F|nr:RNA polymerase sigma factor [Streptomyces sp. NRRL B-3229]
MLGARHETPPPDADCGPDDVLPAALAAEGDEDAFAVLVHRHAPSLVQLATRLLGTRSAAEDVVRDAFLDAWRRLPELPELPEFQGRSSFGTWIRRIATDHCLNAQRASGPAAPVRVAEGPDAVRRLREALDLLTAEQRVCWILRELDGPSFEFIAEDVGFSREDVRVHVFRARRCLAQALGSRTSPSRLELDVTSAAAET